MMDQASKHIFSGGGTSHIKSEPCRYVTVHGVNSPKKKKKKQRWKSARTADISHTLSLLEFILLFILWSVYTVLSHWTTSNCVFELIVADLQSLCTCVYWCVSVCVKHARPSWYWGRSMCPSSLALFKHTLVPWSLFPPHQSRTRYVKYSLIFFFSYPLLWLNC